MTSSDFFSILCLNNFFVVCLFTVSHGIFVLESHSLTFLDGIESFSSEKPLKKTKKNRSTHPYRTSVLRFKREVARFIPNVSHQRGSSAIATSTIATSTKETEEELPSQPLDYRTFWIWW